MLRVEPGYPRSIVKDFMGCDGPADRDKDRHSPQDDVDIVIKLDHTASTVKAIAIVIPCILALCLLVLVYTVFQFKRKGTPRHILYCKRSMQEWVWCRGTIFLSWELMVTWDSTQELLCSFLARIRHLSASAWADFSNPGGCLPSTQMGVYTSGKLPSYTVSDVPPVLRLSLSFSSSCSSARSISNANYQDHN